MSSSTPCPLLLFYLSISIFFRGTLRLFSSGPCFDSTRLACSAVPHTGYMHGCPRVPPGTSTRYHEVLLLSSPPRRPLRRRDPPPPPLTRPSGPLLRPLATGSSGSLCSLQPAARRRIATLMHDAIPRYTLGSTSAYVSHAPAVRHYRRSVGQLCRRRRGRG